MENSIDTEQLLIIENNAKEIANTYDTRAALQFIAVVVPRLIKQIKDLQSNKEE